MGSSSKRIERSALDKVAESEPASVTIQPVSTIIGQRSSQNHERKVLLVGETGAGKSTLVNCLANYFLGGELHNLKVIIPNKVYRWVTEEGYAVHSEANIDDPTVSQTKKWATYTFQKNDVAYTFIDTPGLCDSETSGVRGDTEVINAILAAACQAEELHAVIMIINGSMSKLTVNLRSALQQLASNCPNAFDNNMFVVFTNSSLVAPTFDLSSLPYKPKHYFTMNNQAFSSRPEEWDEEESVMQRLCWEKGMRSMGAMVNLIERMLPQLTTGFNSILDNRNKMRGGLLRLIVEIENLENFEAARVDIREKLVMNQSRMQQYQTEITRIHRHEGYENEKTKIIARADEAASREQQGLRYRLENSWENLYRTVMELNSRQRRAQCEFQANDFEVIMQLAQNCRIIQESLTVRGNQRADIPEFRSQTTKRPASASIRSNKTSIEAQLVSAKEADDDFQSQLEKIESLQSEAENRLKMAKMEVEHSLQELKETCSNFNDIEESAQAKEILATSMKSLRTERGKKYVREFLESLNWKSISATTSSERVRAKKY